MRARSRLAVRCRREVSDMQGGSGGLKTVFARLLLLPPPRWRRKWWRMACLRSRATARDCSRACLGGSFVCEFAKGRARSKERRIGPASLSEKDTAGRGSDSPSSVASSGPENDARRGSSRRSGELNVLDSRRLIIPRRRAGMFPWVCDSGGWCRRSPGDGGRASMIYLHSESEWSLNGLETGSRATMAAGNADNV